VSDRVEPERSGTKGDRNATGLEKFFSEAQRRNFERGRAEGKAEGKAQGKAKGEAAALLKILMRRGLTLTTE
jgi:flagellar biosynthesis/type III secretory pathway protein FliH